MYACTVGVFQPRQSRLGFFLHRFLLSTATPTPSLPRIPVCSRRCNEHDPRHRLGMLSALARLNVHCLILLGPTGSFTQPACEAARLRDSL